MKITPTEIERERSSQFQWSIVIIMIDFLVFMAGWFLPVPLIIPIPGSSSVPIVFPIPFLRVPQSLASLEWMLGGIVVVLVGLCCALTAHRVVNCRRTQVLMSHFLEEVYGKT